MMINGKKFKFFKIIFEQIQFCFQNVTHKNPKGKSKIGEGHLY